MWGEEIGGVAEASWTYGMDKPEDDFLHGDTPQGCLEIKTLNSSESMGFKIRINVIIMIPGRENALFLCFQIISRPSISWVLVTRHFPV